MFDHGTVQERGAYEHTKKKSEIIIDTWIK